MQDLEIIKVMDEYAAEISVSTSSLGQMAVQNRKAYERIKNGTSHRDTGARIIEWIAEDRKKRTASGEVAA